MIQDTIARLATLADERDIFVITGAAHSSAVQQQLLQLDS